MQSIWRSVSAIAACVVLAIVAIVVTPAPARAQIECWSCQFFPTGPRGYYECTRNGFSEGSSSPDGCDADFDVCEVSDPDCQLQDFAADGSVVSKPELLAGETTAEEHVVVVANAAALTEASRVIRRSSCTGAILARHLAADVAAQARAASRTIVI